MRKIPAVLFLAILGVLVLAALTFSRAAVEPAPPLSFQYAILKWGGSGTGPANNVHVDRPDSKVEFYGPRLAREKAPEGADERAYYMNLVMNLLAKEGYEFAGMTDDQIVMKRAERR